MIDSVQRILLHFAALVAVMSLAAAFAAFAFRAGFVRAAFAAPLGLWRGMTPAGRFVSAAFVTVSVIYGGTKTNALPLRMMRQSALPVSPAVTDAEIERGYRRFCSVTNEDASYAMPPDASLAGNWHRRGTFGEWMRLDLDGFEFPMGTNGAVYSSFSVFNDGKIRPTPRDTAHEISAVGVPMLAMQGASRFWTQDDADGSKLLAWENFFLDADTNAPVNARIRLYPDGNFSTCSNGIETVYRRIYLHDWDGDGLANEIDPDPRASDGDFFGVGNPLPAGANPDAYYWLDLSVTGALGVARIDVVCDGKSDLGDHAIIARSGQTCRVPLLAGADYEVKSDLPFETFALSDTNATAAVVSERRIRVSYPLAFRFVRVGDETPPLLRGALQPDGDDGGAATNRWRIDVRPVDPGITVVSVTGACCNVWTDEALFFWECEDDCGCRADRPEILGFVLAWEGHTNKFNYAFACPCRESEMEGWHVGSPALWLDMPETLFVNNDDTNDFSDVVNLTVGWAAADATNGTVTLDMRFRDDDAAIYADQELTERVPLPLLMDGREPCETNFYVVGLRESAAYANNAVTLAWHDGGGNLLGRTERSFTVLCPIADVVNNSLYSGGELCNPAAIVAGTNAPFAITFSSLYPPEETIVWSVEEGDAEFVGGMNTGSCVRVSSFATNTAVTLKVQIGDAKSRPVKFRAYVVEPLSVKTTVWIVGNDDGSYYASDVTSVSNMVAGVNKLYEQIGVSFYVDSISFTNKREFLDLSYPNGKCNFHIRRKLVSSASDTGGLEIYFVNKISNRAKADHDRFGIVVSTNATAKSIAHEIGHAFGCVDVYYVQKSNKSSLLRDRCVNESKAYQDWSNGAGCRYYHFGICQDEIIGRLLMCGYDFQQSIDMTSGSIYGYTKDDDEGLVNCGFFTNGYRKNINFHQ